jgi:hypothetical protein
VAQPSQETWGQEDVKKSTFEGGWATLSLGIEVAFAFGRKQLKFEVLVPCERRAPNNAVIPTEAFLSRRGICC